MPGEMSFTSVADIVSLEGAMQTVELQSIDIEQYAQQWVCQKAGFQPSPVCVLKPLAGAMDQISEVFNHLTSTFIDKWGDVRDEVARSIQDIERQDGDAVTKLNTLKGEVDPYVRLPGGKVIMS